MMSRDDQIQWLDDEVTSMAQFLLELRQTVERLTERVAALEAKQDD